MTILNYISFAVAPALIVLAILYLKYKFAIKSLDNIRDAVLWGLVGVVLLMLSNYLIELRWHDNLRNMRRMAFFVFIGVAFSSEFAKFLILRLKFYKLKSFEGPLEGIIYSIFISLGFATSAVVLYAYGIVGTETKFNDMTTLFLFSYPFASITFGTLMGFFIGMGKLRKNWLIDNSTGLFSATFFHGLFYFCFITSDKRLLLFTTVGFLIITITLIYKAVNFRIERN